MTQRNDEFVNNGKDIQDDETFDRSTAQKFHSAIGSHFSNMGENPMRFEQRTRVHERGDNRPVLLCDFIVHRIGERLCRLSLGERERAATRRNRIDRVKLSKFPIGRLPVVRGDRGL